MEKLKTTRILGAIGISALILGIYLPYYKFSFWGISKTISLWNYWEGKVMMALTLANLLFIFKDFVKKYIPQLLESNIGLKIENANEKCAIIPTILVVAFTIYLTIRLDIDTTYIKHGTGFYALWLGIICLVGHSFLYKKRDNEEYQIPQSNHYI